MATAPLHRRFVRVLSWHRRKLAAGLAAIAVAAGINAAAPPDPPTVAVQVTSHVVPAGRVLVADDLTTVRRQRDDLPDGFVSDPDAVVGRTVVAALPRGRVVDDSTTFSPRQATGDRVIVPLRLADPDLAALLRPGEAVDVVATDEQNGRAEVVARQVRVVTTLTAAKDSGLLDADSATESGETGLLCLVEVDQRAAIALAGAGARRQLSVIWDR